MNPATQTCGDQSCSDEERSARVALLLKSFPGYLAHLATTDEAAALGNLVPLVKSFQEKVAAGDIESLLSSENQEEVQAGIDALSVVLESEELRDLINPALLELVQGEAGKSLAAKKYHAEDILDGVKGLGSFSADNDRIFFRPGLLDFASFAGKIGRVASFYAGYGPVDSTAMEGFLSACAAPGMGKNWFEVSQMSAGSGTCGELFDTMLGKYRSEWITGVHRNRVDDRIGATLHALVSTSVMVGGTAEEFRKADALYREAKEYDFRPQFDDVKFGYWGSEKDLQAMAKNTEGYDDLKTKKFVSLGTSDWYGALRYSPAEPGLSAALALSEGGTNGISAGGWSDLHPVLGLRNLGCDQVVYVTRTGEESGFAQGVAQLLGMRGLEQDALYNLDNAYSSFTQSLEEADAVWCTDWDNQEATDLVGITTDSYNAPLESGSQFFTDGASVYPNLEKNIALRGCTPGFVERAN